MISRRRRPTRHAAGAADDPPSKSSGFFRGVLALLALVCLTATPRSSRADGVPCLSGRVGELLSASLAAHAFDGALPAGWRLEDVRVERDHVDLVARDREERPRQVTLHLDVDALDGGRVEGRGRSFAFVIDGGPEPLDAAGRKALLDLAARVDAAIPAEEARRSCAPGHRSLRPSADDDAHGQALQNTRWLRVGAAFYGVAIVGAAFGAIAAAWRHRRQLRGPRAAAPAGLTALALVVRLAAHPIPADIREVLGAGMADGYPHRAGWSALLHLLFTFVPPRYETIWIIHRVLGALAVPLLYGALRQRFPRPSVAAAGAAALAVFPLAARFSASDTPYIPLCTAFLGAVVALTHFRRSGSRWALGLGLVLLTAAMQLRPDGPWLVVPAALLVLTVPAVPAGRAFSLATILAGSAFVGLNVIPSRMAIANAHQTGAGLLQYAHTNFFLFGSLRGSPWTDLGMSPWPLSLLVLGGLCVAATRGLRGVGWVAATLVALPLDFPATDQYANARYHLPAAYLACGLAGVGAGYLVERARRRLPTWLDPGAAAVALTLLAALPRLDLLTRMWTPQEEFEFYRAGLRRLGPDCTVVALVFGQDAGFVPFSDPDVATAADLRALLAGSDASPSSCLVYYRGANCRSADAVGLPTGAPFEQNADCQELERRATLVPITETSLRARPYRGERYSVDPVPIGFYRITHLAPPR